MIDLFVRKASALRLVPGNRLDEQKAEFEARNGGWNFFETEAVPTDRHRIHAASASGEEIPQTQAEAERAMPLWLWKEI